MMKENNIFLYYKNINIAIERWKQNKTEQRKKKHLKKWIKTVASYDSLHYCQCDIGRKNTRTKKTKQKQQNNRTTYFMQAANVTWWTEGGRLQRLLGRATLFDRKWECKSGGVDGVKGAWVWNWEGEGGGGYRFACRHRQTCRYELAIAGKERDWQRELWPLRLWAVPFGSWRGGVQLLSCSYVLIFISWGQWGQLRPNWGQLSLRGWTTTHTHTHKCLNTQIHRDTHRAHCQAI